ncbi:DUF2871 domain-containing protein [Eubacteriales bacterium KG127]
MIHLMEPLFDIGYLIFVIMLGLKLLFEDSKTAKIYGIMAILLGLGDSFHLVPRIISHLSFDGFSKYVNLLSWGEFVTSITMTIFYVLFYFYYKEIAGDKNKGKTWIILCLALVRIALVFMPQNQWGTSGNYTFALLRNIPFAIMGILIIVWTFNHRNTPGLKWMSLLITLSFLFYAPVVIGARFITVLGAFMIPKTVVYVLIVYVGYRHLSKNLLSLDLLKFSGTFLILGLIFGVFYREFTKLFAWTMPTTLSIVHVHLIILGFIVLLSLYFVIRDSNKSELPSKFNVAIKLYITGLLWMTSTFVIRGIYTITSEGYNIIPDAALSGIAGIGHIILGAAIVFIFILLLKSEKLKFDR